MNDHGSNNCRSQSVNHVFCDLIGPADNVDSFVEQFLGHSLNATASWTYAGSDRINALILGLDGNLCTYARFTYTALNFQEALINFRHFLTKQFNQEFRAGTGQHNRLLTGCRINRQEVSAYGVSPNANSDGESSGPSADVLPNDRTQ